MFKRYRTTETSIYLDKLKDQGFKYSTYAGFTIAYSDIVTSKHKEEIVETDEIQELCEEEEDVVLTKEEQNKLRKAAKKEFKANLKRAQKAEEEYNQAYNEAYNNYLRKLGYQVKEPWTWKRVKNTIIAILVVVVVCWLIWIIPPTRQILVDFYNENYIVKALVDIVKVLVNAILGIFK